MLRPRAQHDTFVVSARCTRGDAAGCQRPLRASRQKRQKTGRSRLGLNGRRIGRKQLEQTAGYRRWVDSGGPAVIGRAARKLPLRSASRMRAFRSSRRATRHAGQRGETGRPVPRLAATSPGARSKASPQSTQTGRIWPVRESISSGCNVVSRLQGSAQYPVSLEKTRGAGHAASYPDQI